jgi:hypothetical protein
LEKVDTYVGIAHVRLDGAETRKSVSSAHNSAVQELRSELGPAALLARAVSVRLFALRPRREWLVTKHNRLVLGRKTPNATEAVPPLHVEGSGNWSLGQGAIVGNESTKRVYDFIWKLSFTASDLIDQDNPPSHRRLIHIGFR